MFTTSILLNKENRFFELKDFRERRLNASWVVKEYILKEVKLGLRVEDRAVFGPAT